jgi:hypothetical protein
MTRPQIRHLLFAGVAFGSGCVSPDDRDDDAASEVTDAAQAPCTRPDANLVPCPGKRWEGANPTVNGTNVANLQSFEAMQGVQLGVVHFFRTPGSTLWGDAGFQEQVYLNTAAPRANPRHLYLGYRPNADWSLFDGAGSDDAPTISRIHADARRTIALFAQAHRKVWINAVNHEPERYVFGCGGGNATSAHNTVASYLAAWRNVVAIFDGEIAAAGLPTRHADPQYPVVWAINTQNLVKATNPATCKDEHGNGLSTFRALMLALAPRTTSGALIIQWFGWNPYTPAGGRTLPAVIDARRLNANSFPKVRMLLYFDAVAVQDPATVGFGDAFRAYATSSTMFH